MLKGSKKKIDLFQKLLIPSLPINKSLKINPAKIAPIDNIIKGGAIQDYKIGTRSAKKYDLAELMVLKGEYAAIVAREKQAETMANGLGNPRALYVRFK